MSAATKLTNEIIDYIYRNGGYAWRASSVGVFDQRRNLYRTSAKRGVSDILAVIPPNGRLIAIEVKLGGDVISEVQEGFLKNIKNAGGISIVAKNFEDFKKEWSQKLSKLPSY